MKSNDLQTLTANQREFWRRIFTIAERFLDINALDENHPLFHYNDEPERRDHLAMVIRKNAKKLGFFKSEVPKIKDFIKSGIFLRPKLYVLVHASDEQTKRAKGVKKCVVEREITFDDYRRTVIEETDLRTIQYNFRPHKFNIYLEIMNKNSLSLLEFKRLWPSKYRSFPYGFPKDAISNALTNDDDGDDATKNSTLEDAASATG